MDLITGLSICTKGLHYMPEIVKKIGLGWKLMMLAFGIFWIIMLVNCLQRKFKVNTDKIAWILVLVFVPVIGAFIYLFWLFFEFRKNR